MITNKGCTIKIRTDEETNKQLDRMGYIKFYDNKNILIAKFDKRFWECLEQTRPDLKCKLISAIQGIYG